MKKLDIFKKSITLGEVLNVFKNEKIFVEVSSSGLGDGWGYLQEAPLELLFDEEEENEIGLFLGNNCQVSLSKKSVCRVIDKDAIKIIDDKETYKVGMILRFKSLKPLNLF